MKEAVNILLYFDVNGRYGLARGKCNVTFFSDIITVHSKLCEQKKSPNVYKSCPKMISIEKWKILTPLQKLPKNVGDLGKWNVAKGFEKLLKVQ